MLAPARHFCIRYSFGFRHSNFAIITAVESEWGYARNERPDRRSAMTQIPSALPERGSEFNKAFANLCWRPGGKTEDERWL